jgi:hypothetical protein
MKTSIDKTKNMVFLEILQEGKKYLVRIQAAEIYEVIMDEVGAKV